MFICPAAAARMLTDRLIKHTGVSLAFAALAGSGGYIAAAWAPFWLGSDHSLGASGTAAVAAGLILSAAVLFARPTGCCCGEAARGWRCAWRRRSDGRPGATAMLIRF